MSSISTRRLQKELKEIHKDCPQGIKLIQADDFETRFLSLEVLGESLYQDETFMLKFRFDAQYPISSPSVTFVADDKFQPPLHPHVYSNGHICANILGDGWSPVLSVTAICISLQSMLASCRKKERPEGNDRYVMYAPEDPKKSRFIYEDDTQEEQSFYFPLKHTPSHRMSAVMNGNKYRLYVEPTIDQTLQTLNSNANSIQPLFHPADTGIDFYI